MKRIQWINLILGIWLLVGAWALPEASGASTANDMLTGMLLLAFSWWRLETAEATAAAMWVQVLCGAWLCIGPFAFGYPAWNSVVCGILAMIVAVVAGQRAGHRSVA